MAFKFVVGLRACCVAAALMLTAAEAAESQAPSLVGATREQVLQRLGEPRSSIVAGSREVLLFARERVVLRNNVVIEVDLLPSDPAPPENVQPDLAGEAPPPGEQASEAQGPTSRDATVAPPPSPDNAPLEIRAVRPAGSSGPRPARRTEPAPAAGAPAPSSSLPPAEPVPSAGPPAKAVTASPTETALRAAEATPDETKATTEARPAAAADTSATEKTEEKAGDTKGAAARKTEKAEPEVPTSQRSEPAQVEEPDVFTANTYLIAFVIVVGGIGYLFWRSRQRKLELAATAVSRTPFATPVAAPTGARFTADLLSKLEWKRFEQLVAAYYGKTGVVAVRTNTGPSTPVHIKISWKGESRPFAFVQCIAHPTGLVDAKSVQELVASLMAEDIRRGYVVTTGKFNVPARDFAEEKHITLLPGDIFLEKLNALPDGARNELMQEVATGDYTTPSCPKCDAKMVRSPDDPTQWRCPTHPDMVIPAWK